MIDQLPAGVQVAGFIRDDIVIKLTLGFPNREIYLNPGAIRHMQKKHPADFAAYFYAIPDILFSPEYVGCNPKEPDSVELIKNVNGKDVLVAVKKDVRNHVLYLSSMYELPASKVPNRLASGRIVKR